LRRILQKRDLPEEIKAKQANRRHGPKIDDKMLQPPDQAELFQRFIRFRFRGGAVVWRRRGRTERLLQGGGSGIRFFHQRAEIEREPLQRRAPVQITQRLI